MTVNLSDLHPDNVEIISAPKKQQSVDLTSIHPNQIEVEQPEGVGSKILGDVGAGLNYLGNKYDQFVTTPIRAAVNNITGGASSNYSYLNAPESVPNYTEIANKNLGIQNDHGKKFAMEKPAVGTSDIEKKNLLSQGYIYNPEHDTYIKQMESATPAQIAGGAMDFALDPINAISLGDAALARAVGKTAKVANRALFGIKLAENAPEVKAAMEEIGATVTPGQLIETPIVKKMENLQSQSHGQLGGSGLRTQLEENQAKAQLATKDLVKTRSEISKAESGIEFEKKFSDELAKKIAPAEQVYGAWEDAFRQTGLPVSKDGLASNLEDIAKKVEYSPEGMSAVNQAKDNIGKLQNLDDLKRYRSIVGAQLGDRNLDPNTRYVLSSLYKGLSDTRSASLQKLAELPQYKDFAEQAIVQLKEADKIYAEGSGAVENALLKRGKSLKGGPKRTATNFFESNSDIEKVNKVLQTKDPAKIEQLSKDFPEAFNTLKQAKIEEIAAAATNNGVINNHRFISIVDKMPPESQVLIFGKDAKRKIDALKVISESMPQNVNPSGTSITEILKNLVHPWEQTKSIGRSVALHGLTAPELGTDVFTKFGNSDFVAPLTAYGGLRYPGQNQGLQLPRK